MILLFPLGNQFCPSCFITLLQAIHICNAGLDLGDHRSIRFRRLIQKRQCIFRSPDGTVRCCNQAVQPGDLGIQVICFPILRQVRKTGFTKLCINLCDFRINLADSTDQLIPPGNQRLKSRSCQGGNHGLHGFILLSSFCQLFFTGGKGTLCRRDLFFSFGNLLFILCNFFLGIQQLLVGIL